MRYAQALPRRRHCFIKCAATVVLTFLVASTCGAQAKPTGQASEEQWAQELKKHPELLAEFGRLFEKLQSNVQFPEARRESRLLPLLPEATMSYAAFPNYGDAAHQTVKIFRQIESGCACIGPAGTGRCKRRGAGRGTPDTGAPRLCSRSARSGDAARI